jgi:hypothetical protein
VALIIGLAPAEKKPPKEKI